MNLYRAPHLTFNSHKLLNQFELKTSLNTTNNRENLYNNMTYAATANIGPHSIKLWLLKVAASVQHNRLPYYNVTKQLLLSTESNYQ